MRHLTTIDRTTILWDEKCSRMTFIAGMAVNADGSPHAYHPQDKGLDYLDNARDKKTNKWWGVVLDKNGKPVIQKPTDPAPGYYVSPTSYFNSAFRHDDPRRYLNSEKIPFVVIPLPVAKMVRPVVLGSNATITDQYTGKVYRGAVVGDFGPLNKIGEASIFLANYFGLNPSPRNGGTNIKRFIYEIDIGTPADNYRLIPLRA